MMPVLPSTGLALHDLGLSAGFGGSLFGKIALNPAVKIIGSREERGQVVNAAWNGFNIVNAASVGLAAITWLVGRSRLMGREIDRTTRGLVITKNVLLGTTVALGAANILGGANDIDRNNTERMKQIVRKVGFPGKSLVGNDGVWAAWAIIQHSPDPEFQQYCLPLIYEAAKSGEIEVRLYAYLEDRVRIKSGQQQLYGTQLQHIGNDGVGVQPLDDPANVHTRRKDIGLEPLSMNTVIPNKAFEVRMQPDGRGMEWIERSPQGETRYTTEPGAGPLKRSWIDLLEILPIEWLL